MCLEYATPHRYRRVFMHGDSYPLECHDKTTLKTMLQQEFADGLYTKEHYHPLFLILLRALAENDAALPTNMQEPNYPYCDLVQSVALLFGYANGGHFAPDVPTQNCHLRMGIPITQSAVYAFTRLILTECCTKSQKRKWYPVLKRHKLFAQRDQFTTLMLELGLKGGYVTIGDAARAAA